MSARADANRPTPAIMPRRRPAVPPAPRPPTRATFQVAAGTPRRGRPDAIVWPDTGLLLGLGTDQALLGRFRRHYGGRVRMAKSVARELRGLAERPSAGDSDATGHDVTAAAALVVRTFLLGDGVWPLVEPGMDDLPDIALLVNQLKALSASSGKRHGGEAEIIVLAARAAAADDRQQVLLANDGGASIVAYRHGIPTRHIGDVLAEFACADPEFEPDQARAAYEQAARLSCPPVQVRPRSAEAFACAMVAGVCATCDRLEVGGAAI